MLFISSATSCVFFCHLSTSSRMLSLVLSRVPTRLSSSSANCWVFFTSPSKNPIMSSFMVSRSLASSSFISKSFRDSLASAMCFSSTSIFSSAFWYRLITLSSSFSVCAAFCANSMLRWSVCTTSTSLSLSWVSKSAISSSPSFSTVSNSLTASPSCADLSSKPANFPFFSSKTANFSFSSLVKSVSRFCIESRSDSCWYASVSASFCFCFASFARSSASSVASLYFCMRSRTLPSMSVILNEIMIFTVEPYFFFYHTSELFEPSGGFILVELLGTPGIQAGCQLL